MPDEQQPVDNSKGTVEPTEKEPSATPTGEDNSQQFQMPEKFKGKSPEDIVKSYVELERKVGNYSDIEKKALLYDEVSPILEAIRQPQKPGEVDPSQFQSAEEFIQYMDGKSAKERQALEHKLEARIEAERKLSEVREAYPEMKTDKTFRDFVIMKMNQNPSADVMDAAKSVKEYFAEIETRGREATKKEFLEKGGFQGKIIGNQPQRSSEDEETVQKIIGAGDNSGSVFG